MNIPIITFNSGELTPKVDARTDVEKLSSGCKHLEDMLPLIYGCAERRPGTRFVTRQFDDTEPVVRMVPFIYSATQAFPIEFGDLYVRPIENVFYESERIYYTGDEVFYPWHSIVSTYLAEDLFEIHFKQLADVMWLVHPSYPQRKLSRTTTSTISLDTIAFTKGPFLVRNDIKNDDDVTLTCDVIAKDDSGTLTSSDDVFLAGHAGALFKLIQPRVNTIANTPGELATTLTGIICEAIDIKGTFTFNTHGTWTATIILQRNEDSAGWEDYRTYVGSDDRNIQLTATEDADNVQYRANVTEHTSGTISADITVNESTQEGIVRVDTYVSAQEVAVTVLSALASVCETKRWAEGAWSDVRGYPSSVVFFEDRCIYSGKIDGLNTNWLSETGDYENFEEGVKDADSFSLAIMTQNTIQWIEAIEAIFNGTSGDEWKVGSNDLDTPITPTNFTAKQQVNFGSKNIQPIKVGEVILFIDFVGRKVRELTFGNNKYVAHDITALAEHITESGIVCISLQRNPDSILWCVLDDGTLVSMTYEREQNVVAWAKHPIDGDVQSVCVVPGDDEDDVWISITRTIDDEDIIYIEKFSSRLQPALIENEFFVDCGITYEGAETATISGLGHLVGETVTVLGDGTKYTPTAVVDSNGEVVISTAVEKAQAGLPYTSKLQPMKPVVSTQMGTTAASIVSAKEMGISFFNTAGAQYGTSDDNLFDIDFTDARWENTSEITGLFTGTVVVSVDGGFSLDNPLIISSSSPLPMTVRAIVPRLDVTGR